MKVKDLEKSIISISDLKANLSEVIAQKQFKIVYKNNTPTACILPFEEYIEIKDSRCEIPINSDMIVLPNGEIVKVITEIDEDDDGDQIDSLSIRVYKQFELEDGTTEFLEYQKINVNMRNTSVITPEVLAAVRSLANKKYEVEYNEYINTNNQDKRIKQAYDEEKDFLITTISSLNKRLNDLQTQLESSEIKQIDTRRITALMMRLIEKIGSYNQTLDLSTMINDYEDEDIESDDLF